MGFSFEISEAFTIDFVRNSQSFKFKNDSKNAIFCAYFSFIITIALLDNENISFDQFFKFLKN